MGKNSSIEWTDHTFNPWWGCVRVSPGCQNCYAETWARRVGADVWGAEADRRFFGKKHWQQPVKWNAAVSDGRPRKRVFCASMADVFELRADLVRSREQLWTLITATSNLDWLLLTKRPENILSMAPWTDWPNNVWIGTTVEDQVRAEERIPHLMQVPALKRFLSCEPLLGPVDLGWWLDRSKSAYGIDWVIAGGESGFHARPMMPGWVRRLRDQCKSGGIPFHFKQWGHWAPTERVSKSQTVKRFWDEVSGEEILMEAMGKKDAGRHLDGVTWDELPKVA